MWEAFVWLWWRRKRQIAIIVLHLQHTAPDGEWGAIFKARLLVHWFMMNIHWTVYIHHIFKESKVNHHISTLDSEGLKKPLASRWIYSGDTSEPLRLPEWEQDSRPKSLKGECVSNSSERGSGEQKIQSQAASQKAWASCLSQPGTSRHVSTSCPGKNKLCGERSSVHAPVERGRTPTAGYSFLGIRIPFMRMSFKSRSQSLATLYWIY